MDEAFTPFGIMVARFFEHVSELRAETEGFAMRVTACEINAPIEFVVNVDSVGALEIGFTPPLYTVMTSLPPVFHQLVVRATLGDADDGG